MPILSNYNNKEDKIFIIIGSLVTNIILFLLITLFPHKFGHFNIWFSKLSFTGLIVNTMIVTGSILSARYLAHINKINNLHIHDFTFFVLIIQIIKSILMIKLSKYGLKLNKKYKIKTLDKIFNTGKTINTKLFVSETSIVILSIIMSIIIKKSNFNIK